jgi:hypothetical protein
MSTNDPNPSALEKDSQASSRQQQKCGCCLRNWRCVVPTLLLALIVLGGGTIYWSLFIRVYRLGVCRSVMQTIQENKDLQDVLGQPIQTAYWPSRETAPNARIEENEIDVLWTVEGPKGRAKAHARAEWREGKWETIVMEVVLPGGKKVLLTPTGDDANEAPPADFANPKPETKNSEVKGPAPEINLPIPPGDEPGTAK